MQIVQTIRSLRRDPVNTLIMIISLAVGILCVDLILIFLTRELGTDTFHKDGKHIYALKCDDPWLPGKKIYYCKAGSAEYIRNNFSQVEDYCRVNNSGGAKIIVGEEEFSDRPSVMGASENFFSFFSYDLISGDKKSVLATSENLVISSDLASKYFGSDDPIGKIITLEYSNKSENMIVTGVFASPVYNTQLKFDLIRLIGNIDSRCYLKLTETADKEELEKLFLEKKDLIPVISAGSSVPYYIEPFKDAYFDTLRNSSVEVSRDKRDLWIAMVIGLMIIVIAVLNFLGITANKFQGKVKEYYLRRIHGSSLHQLTGRFMSENLLVIFTSSLLGLLLTFDALPLINTLTDSNITSKFVFMPQMMSILVFQVLFIVLITLLSGAYLIRINLDLFYLRTELQHKIMSIQIPAFNIFQIASTIILIICSFVIIKQMNFIAEKPLGLNRDVIEIKIPVQYKGIARGFREELLKSPTIENISIAGASPLLEHFLVSLKYNDGGIDKQYTLAGFSGDEYYIPVLGIEVIKGTGFSEVLSSNSNKCLVNQAFADLFPGQDLIGKGIPGMENKIILGIIKDFNYFSLKSVVEPSFISYDDKGGHLLVKPLENQAIKTREAIAITWKRLIPDFPLNIESVDERFAWFHRDNMNFKKLILICSIISLFLSMIGLFAVSFQRSRFRTKEIGIRKINGSQIWQILVLINRDFLKWTLIAYIIAVPVSMWAMNKWLNNYAFRTHIQWWIYLLAGIIVLVISFLTVSLQSWRAATRNPVEALRYE